VSNVLNEQTKQQVIALGRLGWSLRRIGQAAIQQGYRVLYRETHVLLDELAEAVVDGTRREFMETLTTVPLLIID
jgi:DNA replication protein DnaC